MHTRLLKQWPCSGQRGHEQNCSKVRRSWSGDEGFHLVVGVHQGALRSGATCDFTKAFSHAHGRSCKLIPMLSAHAAMGWAANTAQAQSPGPAPALHTGEPFSACRMPGCLCTDRVVTVLFEVWLLIAVEMDLEHSDSRAGTTPWHARGGQPWERAHALPQTNPHKPPQPPRAHKAKGLATSGGGRSSRRAASAFQFAFAAAPLNPKPQKPLKP